MINRSERLFSYELLAKKLWVVYARIFKKVFICNNLCEFRKEEIKQPTLKKEKIERKKEIIPFLKVTAGNLRPS